MKLHTLIGAAVAALFITDSAFALSCARTDVKQAMEQVKSSDDLYYVLAGSFQSAPMMKKDKKAVVDKRNRFETAQPRMVEAWFDGRILSSTAAGDTDVTRFPIDVEVSCAGPWCGSAPVNGKEVIAFVKARPGLPMLLSAGPCPSKVFPIDAKMTEVKSLRACFDKNCAPTVDPRFDKR